MHKQDVSFVAKGIFWLLTSVVVQRVFYGQFLFHRMSVIAINHQATRINPQKLLIKS